MIQRISDACGQPGHTATDAYPEDGYDGSDRYQHGEAIRFLPKELKSIDS